MVLFETSHLDEIKPSQWFSNYYDSIKTLASNNKVIVYTFMLEDKPACIVGAYKIHDGVSQVFSIMSDLIKVNVFDFTRQFKLLVHNYTKVSESHRLQFYVKKDFKEACRFAEFLGFNEEGLMRKFGPDKQDFYLYARVLWLK